MNPEVNIIDEYLDMATEFEKLFPECKVIMSVEYAPDLVGFKFYGNTYRVSSRFVEYLIKTFMENKLCI
jgi:hypothetical protein